ncbi:MAG: hypothetical protein KAR12_13535, partial [Methylococcales bacterium]|nr:hypothetical protein [Methylococcales bacterium]
SLYSKSASAAKLTELEMNTISRIRSSFCLASLLIQLNLQIATEFILGTIAHLGILPSAKL